MLRVHTTIERRSAQILVHDDILRFITIEHPEPPPATVDAHARAIFAPGITLDLSDQWKPAFHVVAAASRDDANLAVSRIDQDGRRRCVDRASVPRDPQQATAGEDVGLDIYEGVQLGAMAGRIQERAGVWPDFMYSPWIDAKQF